MRLSILSNVNLDMLSGLLKKENEVFQTDGYGEWITYDFKPLRFINGQRVVLGLVTSKTAALENPEDLKERIREAAAYVPLENLCLSPQCGFASTEEGNILTEEEQWAKIRLVAQVAEEVWQDA